MIKTKLKSNLAIFTADLSVKHTDVMIPVATLRYFSRTQNLFPQKPLFAKLKLPQKLTALTFTLFYVNQTSKILLHCFEQVSKRIADKISQTE